MDTDHIATPTTWYAWVEVVSVVVKRHRPPGYMRVNYPPAFSAGTSNLISSCPEPCIPPGSPTTWSAPCIAKDNDAGCP